MHKRMHKIAKARGLWILCDVMIINIIRLCASMCILDLKAESSRHRHESETGMSRHGGLVSPPAHAYLCVGHPLDYFLTNAILTPIDVIHTRACIPEI